MKRKTLALCIFAFLFPSAAWAGFLASPLHCGDRACTFRYNQGVYTSTIINTVLDHKLKLNSTGFYQYGTYPTGSDGFIRAFNGEFANGNATSIPPCVGGVIHLAPAPGVPDMVINPGPCGSNFASYDEHPGYDYRASCTRDSANKCIVNTGTPVYAASGGKIVNNSGMMCVLTNISSPCSSWGYIGIDHGNGYITQYGHLSRILVAPGQAVSQGAYIGDSGNTSPATTPGKQLGPHLHFEVIKLLSGHSNNYQGLNYAVVDPYGWVGGGTDPLTTTYGVASAKLWQ